MRWEGKHGNGSWALRFQGVINNIKRRMQETQSEAVRQMYARYFRERPCRACQGRRLRPEARAVLFGGKNIVEVTSLTVATASQHFEGLSLQGARAEIAAEILKEIKTRLGFLLNVGLDYLTLERSAATLSGGEAQRIRLASQLGSELSGVMYVLDEPSIGLHQRDNLRLIAHPAAPARPRQQRHRGRARRRDHRGRRLRRRLRTRRRPAGRPGGLGRDAGRPARRPGLPDRSLPVGS